MWQEVSQSGSSSHQLGEKVGAGLGMHCGTSADVHNGFSGSFLDLLKLPQCRVHLLQSRLLLLLLQNHSVVSAFLPRPFLICGV